MICTILSTGAELQTPCRNEQEPPMLHCREHLFELIQRLCLQGYDTFQVDAEYGVPLWAAEFVLALKEFNPIRLHIFTPYEEQTTNWSEDLRDRYFSVHAKADDVRLLQSQFSEDCYERAAKHMTNQSDLLVICGAAGSLPETAAFAEQSGVKVAYLTLV